MEFIKQHRHHLEYFEYKTRILFSGSFSEIPAVYFLSNPTDVDFMVYRTNICAVPKGEQPPSGFVGELLTIDPQGLSPGYVTLKKLHNEYYKHLQTFHYDFPNGPALQTPVGWSALTFDSVFSVRCPYWPPEAQEWQTRQRPYGWPSKNLIDQVVSDGCFLVGKSHPNFNDDDGTQWRYSFSKAEMRLISSWTDNQKYVYHVLRMIKSQFIKKHDANKTGLCTYHLKTQMLWACEQKPDDFWEDKDLMTCICEILTQIQDRFTAKNFPNYFLPDCNIIEGIVIQDNFHEAMKMLNTELGRSLLMSQLPPKVCQGCRLSVAIPMKMAPFVYVHALRFGLPFQVHRPNIDVVQELIDEELDDLMNGIYNTQLMKRPGDSYYSAAEQNFKKGIPCTETVSSNVKAKRINLKHQASLDAITALYGSLEDAELSPLETGQTQWDFSVAISCTENRCPYDGKFLHFPWKEEEHGKFYEKWMNPTHLLSAAYLSNLYFITEQYQSCIELVDRQDRLAMDAFNSELFPMVFCPELASLFDESLQEVLGFLWLLIHLLGDERIFEFSTCPHLFMRYIRMQSSLRLGDKRLEDKYRSGLNVHRENCKYRFHLYSNYYVPLEMAWRISERRRMI